MSDTKIDRLMRWHAGRTTGPWQVTVFPTNRCNLRCTICWQRGTTDLSKTDETPDERLLELVDECAVMEVRDWCITGGGEPFLRGELVMNMCSRIRAHDMNGVLQTNGMFLTKEHLEPLIEIGWRRLNVSLDGPSRKINDDIRGEGAFDKATANVRLLSDLKRRSGADRPIVSLYMVITSASYDKIDRMVELAHELGCAPGGVQLTTMILHSDAGRSFQLTQEQKASLPMHIDRATERAENLGIENNFAIYLREEILTDPNAMHRDTARIPGSGMVRATCFEPWLSVAVTADGKVGPCCAFWDPDADSIRENSFRDVWFGPYLQGLRQKLLEGRPPHYCRRCPANLFCQSDVLREQLRWSLMSRPRRAAALIAKAISSVQRYGLRGTIRRGREWLRSHPAAP